RIRRTIPARRPDVRSSPGCWSTRRRRPGRGGRCGHRAGASAGPPDRRPGRRRPGRGRPAGTRRRGSRPPGCAPACRRTAPGPGPVRSRPRGNRRGRSRACSSISRSGGPSPGEAYAVPRTAGTAIGHHADLPEVTTRRACIARRTRASQHAGMPTPPLILHPALRPLMHTLVFAGVVTWLAVALSLHFLDPAHLLLGWSLLLVFLAAFIAEILLREGHGALRAVLLLVEPAAALALMWLDARPGTAQVLLIVWITQVVTAWPPMRAMLAVFAADVAMYLVFVAQEHAAPLVVTLLNVGFQVFAALCAHYAHSAGQARDRLARVNADLLATRALLADSARD